MANLVDSFSSFGTSDELIDPYCDPCFKEGTVSPVTGYCPKCVEFYCQRCLDIHSRFASLNRHVILRGKDMPPCQADKPIKYELCDRHEGEATDKFCFDHCKSVCGICLVREHEKCQVVPVTEACKAFIISNEEQSFNHSADLLLRYSKNVQQSLGDNIKEIENQKETMLKEAKEYCDKAVEEINKSFQDFTIEVKRQTKMQNFALATDKALADQTVFDIESILKCPHQTSQKTEEARKFLKLYAASEKLKLCADKIKSLDVKFRNITCIFNMSIQPLAESHCKLGEISFQTSTAHFGSPFPNLYQPYRRRCQSEDETAPGSSDQVGGNLSLPVTLTKLDKMRVKQGDDKENQLGIYVFIGGLDTTPNGYIILSEYNHCGLKLFAHDGKLLSSLEAPRPLKDVAVINNLEAAASMDDKIGIIDIAESGQLALRCLIQTTSNIWGITAYKNNLVITYGTSENGLRSVRMIDMNGKTVWKAVNDSKGHALFDSARFLTTRLSENGDSVIVTDWKRQAISVLDAVSGKVIKVCDVKGRTPYGLTVDEHGNIYVCYRSGEVSVWSGDMKTEKCLLNAEQGLHLSYAMAYHVRQSELYLSSLDYRTEILNCVHRYRISMT